ncbi:MAG: SMP-30/gluconolactonase/LRE family protein [Planctomycetota bacterium]|nr:SMP-30/gluconolactonase/LRE family protein [Planctomycetota bacterium]
MFRTLLSVITLPIAVTLVTTCYVHAADEYPVHQDSTSQAGVPKGEVKGPFEWKSGIFPGTIRQYAIYVPAQYDASKPACSMIVQDGLGKANAWKLPTVLDNLIHKGDIPVQLGIFVSPGVVPAASENAQARYNRSYEYDGMSDLYARFLLEELLPEVAKSYNLSSDPNDRLIAGSSSGAICAFTAAWERPHEFRRVFSAVGAFVSLRGGDEYPTLVRKFESKPIRVFLQDGSTDLDIYAGNLWQANQSMLSSLKYSGYDVAHEWGDGGHNGKHSTAIMPDALRWLWRDYPEPIKPGVPPARRTELVIPGEDWELVSSGHQYTDSPAVNAAGEVFFADRGAGTVHVVTLDGQVSHFSTPGEGIGGLMFGPDGLLYGCHRGRKAIVRFKSNGEMETVVEDTNSNDLVMLHDGSGYFTDPTLQRVCRFTPDGKLTVVDMGINFPNGVITSPDQSLLFVSDTRGRFSFSFQIAPGGSLRHKQKYGHVHVSDSSSFSGADGWTVDTEGRRYLTTKQGLQVFDQLGRCHIILAFPQGATWMSNVCFGDPKLDTLYLTCEDKVFRRKINATGAVSWEAPVKPPKPRL